MFKFLLTFSAFLICAVAICLELGCGWAIVNNGVGYKSGFGILSALHFAATSLSVLSCYLYCLPRGGENRRFYICVSGLLTFFIPLIGIVGCAFVLTCTGISKRDSAAGLLDEIDGLVEEGTGVHETATDFNSFVQEETEIEPIIDIINGEDVELKRGAVNLLARIGNADAVKLLQNCLSDKNDEVRFYASTAIARLNDQHIKAIESAVESCEANENDAAVLAKAGDLCRKYAETGLLEASSTLHYLGVAAESYTKALNINRGDVDLKVKLGHLSMRKGERGKAKGYFEDAFKERPDSHEAFLGLCQLFYENWDLDALAANINEARNRVFGENKDMFKMELVNFWTNQEKGV